MKKLCILFMLTFILLGCSKVEEDIPVKESLSLEEQITLVMSENNLKNIEIIDYDIKQNFIYVIFKNRHNNIHYPDLVILKNNNGEVEWVAGPDDRTFTKSNTMVFGRNDGSTVTIVWPGEKASDTKIKDVKVLGKSAKAVTYVEHLTSDFSLQYKYWIAYTKEEPTKPEDIEIIMK